MEKKLTEMTLSELWQLFPIVLTEHRACWRDYYAEQKLALTKMLPSGTSAWISHIGSTAVAGIMAKPIVDILLELNDGGRLRALKETLLQNWWLCMQETPARIDCCLGYTEAGFAAKVYHLHLRCAGDNDELYFRDYLREFPAAAQEYERLKLNLWKRYEHDRDAYTNAKAEFVGRHTALAKSRYRGRYRR